MREREVCKLRASRRALSKNWEPNFIEVIKMEEKGAIASVKPNWSPQQRAFCVNKHAETKSYLENQHLFKVRFKTTKSPSKTQIFEWIRRFKKHGTVTNFNMKSKLRSTHSGRPIRWEPLKFLKASVRRVGGRRVGTVPLEMMDTGNKLSKLSVHLRNEGLPPYL